MGVGRFVGRRRGIAMRMLRMDGRIWAAGLVVAAVMGVTGCRTASGAAAKVPIPAAVVDAGKLPLAAGATVEQALNGGEDYELLVTIPAGMRVPRQVAGVALTVVGEVVAAQAGKPVVTLLVGGVARPLQSDGWQHFTESKR